ncbi:glycosyltransferase [Pectobacterium versatile]|uniref:glycosyltransferase family 2 protein n=1 Tax=Pectobacterium versatile TaxID=2488639 RepID=UPI001B3A1B93|nr:glycosyltransferase family 2 protein [Pectobacterium versatile]MBQ4771625.1 glycosyltransferase [Pectobacterium versatile]
MKINITIPTFNRGKYLYRAIESIRLQLDKIPDGVEVTIRILDNASTDDTLAICEALKEQLPQLEIISHEYNIGGDANILHALKGADGDYIWVFGDDDYLLPCALEKISKYLLENKVSLLKLSSIEERDSGQSYNEEIPGRVIHTEAVPSVEPERFLNPNDILTRFGIGMGNFTTAIFSCEFFHTWYKEPEKTFFESGYSQLEWIYTGLFSHPDGFSFFSEPLVVLRIEMKPRHISSSRVSIGLNFIKKVLIDKGYSHDVVMNVYREQLDAISLGEMKSYKVSSKKIGFSDFFRLSKNVSFKSFLKLVIIYFIPSQFYKKLWEKL